MLYIHLFGNPRLFNGGQLLKFSAMLRTRPLFAYLLLNWATSIHHENLTYLLPDIPEEKACATLRRHLYDLRQEPGMASMEETMALAEAVVHNRPLPGVHTGLAPSVAPPHSLTAQVNAFLGRSDELHTLFNMFAAPGSQVRSVSPTGPAGAGKTRLCLEAGARLVTSRTQLQVYESMNSPYSSMVDLER